MQKHYTYLALGDSYTIGEAVLLHKSFPYQTVQLLRKAGHDFAAPEMIAKTGWTTEELQNGMADYSFASKYDFVTLLIGVNNQYRGQDIILFKEQLESLLKKVTELTGGKKERVFVLSIPDYSVMPAAKQMDVEKIRKEIDAYNNLSRALCIQYKVPFIEITEGYREAKENPGFVAEDGLHPTAAEYTRWSQRLADAMSKELKK